MRWRLLVKDDKTMEIMTFKSCGIQVRVDMRNVRKQLGIQNWDLDVPMVVENRSLLKILLSQTQIAWLSNCPLHALFSMSIPGQRKATHCNAPTLVLGVVTGENQFEKPSSTNFSNVLLSRCQAAFREREEKLYQYHTRYTCPYRLILLLSLTSI